MMAISSEWLMHWRHWQFCFEKFSRSVSMSRFVLCCADVLRMLCNVFLSDAAAGVCNRTDKVIMCCNVQGFTILILVAGSVDNADNFFRRLIMGIVGLLTRDDVPVLVKSLGVK
jgi:hypothetical protein